MRFTKSLLISLLFLILLNACASTNNGPKKSKNRTETIDQVSSTSAEMINVNLGVGYLKRGKPGDLDVALEKFKRSVAINPKFALGHSMLANVYDRKGLFDNAEEHYKLSLKYNNGNPDTVNNYANFLCQRGFYDSAIEKYKLVVNNPEYETPASAYENAGICANKANKPELAEKFFRKALKINSNQANSLYYLMLNYIAKDDYLKARAFLQRLEQVVHPSAEMLAAGYKIEKHLKNDTVANNYLIKLKKEFPNSKSLKNIK